MAEENVVLDVKLLELLDKGLDLEGLEARVKVIEVLVDVDGLTGLPHKVGVGKPDGSLGELLLKVGLTASNKLPVLVNKSLDTINMEGNRSEELSVLKIIIQVVLLDNVLDSHSGCPASSDRENFKGQILLVFVSFHLVLLIVTGSLELKVVVLEGHEGVIVEAPEEGEQGGELVLQVILLNWVLDGLKTSEGLDLLEVEGPVGPGVLGQSLPLASEHLILGHVLTDHHVARGEDLVDLEVLRSLLLHEEGGHGAGIDRVRVKHWPVHLVHVDSLPLILNPSLPILLPLVFPVEYPVLEHSVAVPLIPVRKVTTLQLIYVADPVVPVPAVPHVGGGLGDLSISGGGVLGEHILVVTLAMH